jgi:predicted O-linked N-acetylglucosamine transferase (SPINDLY family)
MDSINYRISDHWADPPGETERFHSEKLLRIRSGFLCFQPPEESPDVSPLPALASGYVTFGSFNVLTKITPEMLRIWAKLLECVEGSRLLIKNKQLTDEALRGRVMNIFQEMGIDSGRIDLLGKTSKVEHMSIYGKVDIALDTFPYNGTTTTCDTLWMGVPVITMAGKSHVSRVGTSLLSSIGLEEFVCTNQNGYISRAVELSRDIDRLSALRGGLRERMQGSPLCDAPSFARKFEELLAVVWKKVQ